MKTLNRTRSILILVLFFAALAMLPASPFTVKALADDVIPVGTAAEFNAVVAELNADGGSKTIELTDDVVISSNPGVELSKGKLTILGGGHKLTGYMHIKNDAELSLGQDGYSKTLRFDSTNNTNPVMEAGGSSVLKIYDGTTIGPSTGGGTAGGIQAVDQSHVYMYGGTIEDCSSALSVAGGIFVTNSAVFDMYDGTITNCSGLQGGGVGVGGGAPIGGSTAGITTFNMHGGTISNCVDKYVGGGGICSFTAYPVIINITGGTITNCSSTSYGYGGAVSVYTSSDTTFIMDGGTIINNSSSDSSAGYGGGLLVYARGANTDIHLKSGTITGNSANYGGGVLILAGNTTIDDGFSLHNNSATAGGDDFYNAAGTVTIGTVDTSAILESCEHPITGWYDDGDAARWSYKECTGEDDYLELFTDTGVALSEEFGLKAAHGELKYVVTWVNYDDTVLEKDEDVEYGATPEYNGDEPQKPATAQYTYKFAGWEPEISEVTKNVTYKAVFTEIPKEYTVTFDSNGGTDVAEQTVPYGDTASKPDDPKRTGYTFKGWFLNGEPYDFNTPVTEGCTLVAMWTKNEDSDPVNPADEPSDDTNGDKPSDDSNGDKPGASSDSDKAPATGENWNWIIIDFVCMVLAAIGAAAIALNRRNSHKSNMQKH